MVLLFKIIQIIVFAVVGFSSTVFAEDIIRISAGEWPPYISEDLKYYGVTMHIISEAFALEGIKAEYEFFSWGRAMYKAEHGDLNGIAGVARNLEREKNFFFTDFVAEGPLVIFHLKSYTFDWSVIEDLKVPIVIGAVVGNTYGNAFQKAENAGILDLERVPNEELNFRKLLAKRINIFPINQYAGYNILQKHFNSTETKLVTHHPKPIRQSTYHLLLSKRIKRNKHYLKLFNRGLKRLKNSGKYDQYIEASKRGEYIKK